MIGWTLGAIVVGAGLYPLLQTARKEQWCRFMGTSPHDFSDALKGLCIPYSNLTSRANSGELAAALHATENGVLGNSGGVAAGHDRLQ